MINSELVTGDDELREETLDADMSCYFGVRTPGRLFKFVCGTLAECTDWKTAIIAATNKSLELVQETSSKSQDT